MTPLIALAVLIVNQPMVNMHSKPTADSDVVSQAIYSTAVADLERQADWVRIRTPDEYTGWVPLAALHPAKEPYAAKGRIARIESSAAHVYREPDVTKHAPLLTLPFESRLEIVAEPPENNGRWLQVKLADGRPAWVQRGDLSFRQEPLSIDEMIALARRFLGVTYTWGGTSSFGFDCSGLSQMLYRRRGITIPRDAGPQFDWTGFVPVEKAALQSGDLLYFGSGPSRITHAGIYIGGGEFISATVYLAPKVQVSRLDEPYWTKLYVGARRLK